MKEESNKVTAQRINAPINQGLSLEQVESRKNQGLTNQVKKQYSKSYLNIFVGNFCTFFNLLGLIVAIALIIVSAPLSRFFFALIYLANISIGIIQEIRAKKCIDKLSIMSDKGSKVIRNGETVEIPSTEIVLDDIIMLGLGSQIPTDCEIIEGIVEVNESLLTGESVPVKKQVGDNLFAGSFIVSGTCYVRAIKVGTDNYVEKLSAKAKKYKKPHSELMNSLRLIIKTVGGIILPIAAAYMIKAIISPDFDLFKSIDGTATVVIGMIPSGMFLLTSMALAVGIIKLFKNNTLVQDLYSLEMLARVDTVCFDKTGTITDGQMTVKEVVNLSDKNSSEIKDIVSSMLHTLKDNNQTAIALYNFFGQNSKYTAKNSLAFNSARKLSAVTFEQIGTYSFGAPEFVLDKETYKNLEQKINKYANEGLRVLVLAHSKKAIKDDKTPNDFSAVALILIEDSIRPDAISTIKWFKENNVEIKVISGDNPITVANVSKRVGIEDADKYISLEGLSDEEVFNVATKYTVFGRVSPEQKAILIKALKCAGHITAMTGDGVNDILALKEADCAVTVASGSDAAKNISHLVLMDNNFSSLPKVVYEGRRVINNVQSSSSLYLMKTLFTMLFSIIMLFMPAISTYPFTLSNMILLEMFVIGAPSFFLSFQPNDSRVEGKFMNYVLSKSLPSALLMVFGVLVVFLAMAIFENTYFDYNTYVTMACYTLTYAGIISLYSICKPLNKFRAVLFFTNLFVILLITIISIGNGMPMLGLEKLWPFETYWHHLLIIIVVLIIDAFILSLLQRLCDKIKLPKKLLNKLEGRE